MPLISQIPQMSLSGPPSPSVAPRSREDLLPGHPPATRLIRRAPGEVSWVGSGHFGGPEGSQEVGGLGGSWRAKACVRTAGTRAPGLDGQGARNAKPATPGSSPAQRPRCCVAPGGPSPFQPRFLRPRHCLQGSRVTGKDTERLTSGDTSPLLSSLGMSENHFSIICGRNYVDGGRVDT